jgi:hypothetical protein
MHQSFGEGIRKDLSLVAGGLVQMVQGGKGIKHGSRLGAGPTLSLCLTYLPTGSDLDHSGTSRVVQILVFGRLFLRRWW